MLHRLTETDRRLALDERRFVQGGINLDEVEVSLEEGGAFSECDTVLLTMERDGMAPVPVRLDTMRVAVPASLMDVPGTLRFSLTGYVGDEVRATTERMRADKCGRVVPSGIIGGGPAPQDAAPDLWKQLMDEVDAATAGAEDTLEGAEQAARAASTAAGQAQSAQKAAEGAASTAQAQAEAASDAASDAAAASSSAADSESKASAAASAASDSASSAASSAGTAADFATEAGNAKTAAETAKTDAESARDAAETAKKGAESAKTAAQSAQKAAEKAKTDAESASTAASNSASQAQQSATSAADSATSVADKFITSALATTLEPGSQATASVEEQVLTIGVPEGEKGDKGDPGHTPQRGVDYWTAEDVEAIVEDAKTQAVAELAEIGNVPKKTVTDLVAHGEDAYAQKPIEVRVKGRTWVNRWPAINDTQYGVTVTTDETGLVTISGTATTQVNLESDVFFSLKSGNSATLAVTQYPSNVTGIFVGVHDPWGAFISLTSGTTAMGTVSASETGYRVGIAIESGQTVNASFRVMLVDGTEAPDCFTPPASIASVETGKLMTAGKNLFPIPSSYSTRDMKFTVNDDGSVTITGTQDKSYIGLPSKIVDVIPGETYRLSGGSHEADKKSAYAQINEDTNGTTTKYVAAGQSFTAKAGAVYRCIVQTGELHEDDNQFNVTVYPQLELGSTATPYEPPTITQTSLPEVELRSLPNGTCDELVIKADGTCEVERKTVQVTFDGSEDEGWRQYAQNTSAFTAYCYEFFADSPINTGTNQETSVAAAICRELPVIQGGFGQTIPSVSISHNANDRLYVTAPSTVTDIDSFKQWLAANPITCVVNVTGKPDEPQSPVTLPTLPAPTFNQYHDADVPSDTSTQYARDINIVLSNLEAVQTALLGGE